MISASPRRPVLSSSGTVWWSEAKIWLRSMASPLRILSHCDEGIPGGESSATLMKNLALATSRLKARNSLRVSAQLGLLEVELEGFLYQGISDSTSFCRFGRLSPSDSSSESTVSRDFLRPRVGAEVDA